MVESFSVLIWLLAVVFVSGFIAMIIIQFRFTKLLRGLLPLLHADLPRFLQETALAAAREKMKPFRDVLLINLSAGLVNLGAAAEAHRVLQAVDAKKLSKVARRYYYNNAVWILLELGRAAEAEELYREHMKYFSLKTRSGKPDLAVMDTVAALKYYTGNFQESRELFTELLNESVDKPVRASQLYYLALLELREGRPTRAGQHLEEAAAVPGLPGALQRKIAGVFGRIKGEDDPAAQEPDSPGGDAGPEKEILSRLDLDSAITGGKAVGQKVDGKKIFFYAVVFFLVAVLTLVGLAIVADDSETYDYVDYAVNQLVNRVVESGLFFAGVDYDDPLLIETRTILITEEINEKTSKEVASKLLYLDNRDPGKPINLVIKTFGGWSEDAFLIADTISMLASPVNTWSAGASYSAGAIILASGTGTRYCLPNSLIMVHVVENHGVDEPQDYKYEARKREEAFWRRHAKLPEDYFPMDTERCYYFSPEEALQYGLVDEIHRGSGRP
jgi:ATP-dependent Clp protease, protease subunit